MNYVEVLVKAKELISQPNSWLRWMTYGPRPTSDQSVNSVSELKEKCYADGTPMPIYSANDKNAFCAIGAVNEAIPSSYGFSGLRDSVLKILDNAAVETAIKHGRPLDSIERGDRYRRKSDYPGGNTAYFNNSALNVEEVKDLFCDAINFALELEKNKME